MVRSCLSVPQRLRQACVAGKPLTLALSPRVGRGGYEGGPMWQVRFRLTPPQAAWAGADECEYVVQDLEAGRRQLAD